MRSYKDFKVSNYALSSFEEEDVCKRRWYHAVVTKEIPKGPPTDAQKKGLYFETLCLGSTAGGEAPPDMGFMYNKDGKESAELSRIHKQVDVFRSLFNPNDRSSYLGLEIIDTQYLIESESEKAIIDIVCKDEDGDIVYIDLKFTADTESEFGDFSWGRNPKDIKWDQFVLQSKICEEVNGFKPKIMVLVMDASPKMNVKIFELQVTDRAINEIDFRSKVVLSYVEKYSKDGAPIRPSKKECIRCTLDCDFRHNEEEKKYKIIKFVV